LQTHRQQRKLCGFGKGAVSACAAVMI
jgi:hypothetical protein